MSGDASQAGQRESELAGEVEYLRARIAQLDAELLEVQTRANTAIAEAQRCAYWLDRWHVDLNEVMRRPAAHRVRALLRAARLPSRWLRKAKRTLRG